MACPETTSPSSVLKSEKLRRTISSEGTPAITGFMAIMGVELGRDGANDPLVTLPESYAPAIPNANQPFNSAGPHQSVLALPLPVCRSIQGAPRPAYIFFRKPRFPKSRPVK